jgi:hypothetical protein
MKYVEEREFNLRLLVRCEFPEEYEGDLDGYAWAAAMPELSGDVLRAAVAALGKRPGYKIRSENRGRPVEDEITLVLDKVIDGSDGPARG